MAKLIVMKKAGEPGEVAVNPDRVTHVRAAGPFTDIWFGETRVAVEGAFAHVLARLNGDDLPFSQPLQPPPPKNWLAR
jgi:hypothetical protein